MPSSPRPASINAMVPGAGTSFESGKVTGAGSLTGSVTGGKGSPSGGGITTGGGLVTGGGVTGPGTTTVEARISRDSRSPIFWFELLLRKFTFR